MNFRTLMMLGLAALVIVVAIKMNRTPAQVSPTMPTDSIPATISGNGEMAEESVMTEDEADDLIYDDMDGTVEPVEEPAGTVGAPADLTQSPTEDTTVGDEPVSEEEAEQLAPAAVEESPADALEDGPAEQISDEPVTATDEKPATE